MDVLRNASGEECGSHETEHLPKRSAHVVVLLTLAVFSTPVEGADSDWSIDFSGQYRIRVEDFEEPFVGLSPNDEFSSIAHRLLGGVNVDYKNRYRLFAQLGTFVENGRKPRARPVDEGDLDIQQLYLDFPLGPENGATTLRLGRQEMSFGASRLVSVRDSPNIRRSFDALKLTFTWRGSQLRAFVGRPVELLNGAFDDKPDTSVAFWGVYGSVPLANDGGLDLYYFGLDRDVGVFDQGVAAETRHTVGARFFGSRSPWDWDGEAAFQFGKFGDGNIRAWFVGGEAGRTWKEARWSPRLAFRAHVFSGDDDPLDPDLQTFNPLFPKTTFFTQLGLFSPTNAIDLHSLVSFSPTQSLRVTASIDFFWRYSTDDALYRPPLLPRIPGGANDERYLGTIWEFLLKWSPTKHMDITLAYDVGNVHGFISEAGGKDPRLLLASVQITF